jgi:type III secretory pathway component EscU
MINACSWWLLLGIMAGERRTLFNFHYASVGGGFILLGLTVGIYCIKYLYLRLLGDIFNLRKIISIQFFELIKISLKLNLLCVPLAIIFFYARAEMLEIAYKYFLYALILCGVIAAVRISFLIFKYSGFRNIYLFSYLCMAEILPLIIIIKVILF